MTNQAGSEPRPPGADDWSAPDIEVGPSVPFTTRPVARTLVGEALVRAGLAFTFVIIFAATIGWAFLNLSDPGLWMRTKELIEILLPAETALLGSAVGFYFGTRKDT